MKRGSNLIFQVRRPIKHLGLAAARVRGMHPNASIER
jgi:hypothetical protein